MSALGQIRHHPSALNNGRAHVPTREASSRGRPNQNHASRARPYRATGKQRLAAVRTTHVPADAPSDQEGLVPRPAESSTNIIRPPNPTNDAKTLGHDRPTVPIADHDPIAGRRPDRPSERRSTRSRF
ncbi:unnamed protein product [Microthlaspi erraticum]|uniref:Uncharacterized protein n=1 Tax=Microthlaspi erraticum TaxID=1685480 RepID=A0A6D2HW76_9BRAS|nr:unnamed protein product [Microthlaspi erraticum]